MTLAETWNYPCVLLRLNAEGVKSGAGSADASGSAVANEFIAPSELSGGNSNGLALARALINRPQLLLADEPTGNLDSRTGTEIMNLVREFKPAVGDDGGDGDARARIGGTLRAAPDFPCGRKLVSDELNSAVIANAGLNPAPERGRL